MYFDNMAPCLPDYWQTIAGQKQQQCGTVHTRVIPFVRLGKTLIVADNCSTKCNNTAKY